MSTNKSAIPFLKWAGGKRQLLPEISKYIPSRFNVYFEPFLGAGAVLLWLQPKKAVINDSNEELINCYQTIKDDLTGLLADLVKHRNDQAYFYSIRDQDRTPEFKAWSNTARASRIIYLNKTCYNGLFRVNSQGQFNVPFGRYKNPKIFDETVLTAVHKYLSASEVDILNIDFEQAVQGAKEGDFVYFDPPYDPVSDTASFTGYDINGFGRDEQIRLKKVYAELTRRGCKVMLSNSSTDFIRDLYRDYTIITVPATRAINSNAARRGKVDEVLVLNYEWQKRKTNQK